MLCTTKSQSILKGCLFVTWYQGLALDCRFFR